MKFALASAILFGLLGGLGFFTFDYGEGTSYFRDDPAACVNCHIMRGHYDSWMASSHQHVATCNDCHLSHDPIGKWVTKADNGFFHSWAFTFGGFPEPIQIKPRNRRVTQDACLFCHKDFVHLISSPQEYNKGMYCVHCHKDVGHALR